MTDRQRYQLLHGPYSTPKVRIGRTVLVDEVRGVEVVVVGLSDARIPWPIGKPKGMRAKAPVVCGDLERAVRLEANQAVCYWFGITAQTVSKWRKVLGVPRANEGTHRLHSIVAYEPGVTGGRAKAHAMMKDPELDRPRREKLSASLTGREIPWRTVKKLIAAGKGRKFSAESRAKMSATRKRLGIPPNLLNGRLWTPEEDEVVRTLPPRQAALKLGRLLGSVYARRSKLKVSDGRDKGRPLGDG